MKFLIDAQLPPAMARWLGESGHDAQAAREVGLREATGDEIWDHAMKNSAALITKLSRNDAIDFTKVNVNAKALRRKEK